MTIRIVLADDHALMRTAFRAILQADGLDVVGEAGDGDEAVAVAVRERPDVVLMDIRMPGRDGLDATAELAVRAPGVRVLVLTTFDEEAYLDTALRNGAAGFLLKNAAPEEVVSAVRRVADGDAVLDPAVTARLFRRWRSTGPATTDRRGLDRLTDREREVLALVARGMTNAEIAAALGTGTATAKSHVSRVLAKIGARDRVQAVVYAYETGFASGP
jgi:DNA-binding NarL/FixJ family response regulator